MTLDVDAIAKDMIEAAKGVVGEKWPTTREYFETEARAYAARLASIEKMYKDGIISESRAKDHVKLQNKAWETTLIAIEGLTQLIVEEALNAAIKAIRAAVNAAIGFALL